MPLNRDNLHDYQNKAVDFILTKERCALLLDMGMGKSVSTLTAISDLHDSLAVQKVLVIAPLRVANSVWAQETEKWDHLKHLRVSVCTGPEKARRAALHRDADVYVINRENVVWLVDLYKKKWPFDAVVVDECFVGETEVLTPSGPLPIKNISVGDVVITSDGEKQVTRVFKKEVTRLVRVKLDDGTEIECTPEHPFATEIGWVQAVDTEGLRVLRSGVQNTSKDEQVLQSELLEKSDVGFENGRPKTRDIFQNIKESNGSIRLERGEALVGRGQEKTERSSQEEWAQTKNTRWERAYRPVRKTHDGDVVFGLDRSVCDTNKGSERERVSDMLQGRFCRPSSQNDNRGGWGISQIAKASGRKEGQVSGVSRVVNVEGFECESSRTVYNLETDGVHDYFAAGTLVHNCSSFKNPSAKRFRALKKVLPYTNYMVLLTGTPSPNSLMDLWPQMYLVDFGESLGRTITGYRQRFFEQDFTGYRWSIREGCDDKIHKLISDRVISMSAEDYLDLPDRIDLEAMVELPAPAMKRYKELEKTLLAELETGEEIEAVSAAALANKMMQFSNGAAYHDEHKNWAEIHSAKLDALADIVEDNPGENMLVAYNYKFDLERLQKRFPQAVILDKEQSTIDRWNNGEIQMLLAHPACLHPKTEVLTEKRGWVKIVDVKDNERVFDGIEFVSHSGCHFSGVKPVIERFGIKMTHDHKMLVNGQWEKAKDVRDTQGVRGKARYTYTGDDGYLSQMLTLRERGQNLGAERPSSKPPAEKALREVYRRDFSQYDQYSDLENLASYAGEDHKRKIAGFQKLRWSWDYCIGRLVKVRKFLSGHGSDIQRRFDFGEGRQFERILQGKLSLGHKYGAAIQQKEQSRFGVSRAEDVLSRILPKGWCVQRSDNGAFECGDDSRAGCFGLPKQQVPEEQEISEVYDLVDCGPRSRFVVRNVDGEVFISHNSAGHGLNLQRGGALCVWFGLNWSLELYQQFNARLHRQGQTKPVRIIHIVAKDTIDQRVLSVLKDKDATQASLLSALKA